MQNLVIGIVLIALALLVGAVFLFHQFGPDIGLTPLPDMEVKAPDDDEATLQVTVGGDPKAEEFHEAAQRALSMDQARAFVEQQEAAMTPTERKSLDDKGRITHTVKKGETLMSLARRYLGDERLWERILDANRALGRPEDLHEGQSILIPIREAK